MSQQPPLLHPDPDQIALPTVLGALSDQTRLAIINYLARNEDHGMICSQFTDLASKTAITYHVAKLREAGVVRVTPEGTRRRVRLRRDDLLVTVSSGGASPAFATWLRDEIDAWLEPAHLELLALLAAERRRMRAEGRPTAHPGWHEALRSGMLERLRDGDVPGAEELLRTCLSSPSD